MPTGTIRKDLQATMRAFQFQNPKLALEPVLIIPSEPMVECPPEDGGCATQWWAEVADAEREPRISYAGSGTGQ